MWSWVSYKGIDHALASDESVLHQIVITYIVIDTDIVLLLCKCFLCLAFRKNKRKTNWVNCLHCGKPQTMQQL